MSWKHGDFFVVYEKDGKVSAYGVVIEQALAVTIPNERFCEPKFYKQEMIPENAVRVGIEAIPDIARYVFAGAITGTSRLM